MAATTHTPLTALAVAQERRLRIAEMRRRAQRGEITLAEIMADPPEELLKLMCLDVVTFTLARGQGRSTAMIERLGKLAVRDGINLLISLDRSSEHTRQWIAEHAAWHRYPRGGHGGGKPYRLVAVDRGAA